MKGIVLRALGLVLLLLAGLQTSYAASSDMRIIRDVAYGSQPAQHFDVYLPAQPKQAPVIFMVHGGGWRIGDKTNPGVVENKVARWVTQGYVFISTNYRMLPEADPITQAEDVGKAMAVAQQKAAEWGADPKRFILMGHSAGAHLVSMLVASPELVKKSGVQAWLGTVALDSAAFNVEQLMKIPHGKLYDEAFGKDPIYFLFVFFFKLLKQTTQPLLVVCSIPRGPTSCPLAKLLVEKSRSLGTRTQLLEENLSHMDINRELGKAGAYTDQVERFMQSLTSK